MTPNVYMCVCVCVLFSDIPRVRIGTASRTAWTRARLEEWPIPDTRVDLTLLYLINYSVRYPILQFVPSHTFSSPLHTAVPQCCSSPPPRNPFFFFFSVPRIDKVSKVTFARYVSM